MDIVADSLSKHTINACEILEQEAHIHIIIIAVMNTNLNEETLAAFF